MTVFQFDDYKEALKFVVRSKESGQRGLYKKIADNLGVHPTLVSQVISGKKDFSEEQLFSCCEFLGLGLLEKQYLWTLLQIERAGSVAIKKHYLELKETYHNKSLKISNRIQNKKELSPSESAIFYSSWIYSAIHLMTTLDKPTDFQMICKRLSLAPKKARDILDFLISAQLVHESNGVFKAGALSTHLGKDSPFLLKHHTNWRLKSIQNSENLSDQELMYTATFSVSKKDFNTIRELLMETINRFLKTVKDSPAEDLAHLNIDCFWLK